MYTMCWTKLIRGIFLPCTTPHYLFTSVSWDCLREGPPSFLFTLCFLETEQKSYRETSAKETGAEVQQRAVELTPVADHGVMRFGEVGHIYRNLARKTVGSEQCSQYAPGFSKKCTRMGENKQKHVKCNEGFSYELLLLFVSGFGLFFTFKGKHLANHHWIPNSFNLNP